MKIDKPYFIHITRRENWSDRKNYNAIPISEWKSYVKSDHQMELINGFEFKFPGEVITVKDDGLTLWKIHSHNGKMVLNTPFSHENGNINVADPDKETIMKMVAIAARLNAKVQGDNGEIYDVNSFLDNRQSKPWWKFW